MALYIGNQKVCPTITVGEPPKTYTYNVDFVGDKVVYDKGIAEIQGFSTSSYIKTKDPIINQMATANSWKISLNYQLQCYKEYSTVFSTGDANMSSQDYQAFSCTYEGSNLKMFLGSTGSSWDYAWEIFDIYGNEYYYPMAGFNLVFELEFTGTQYIVRLKNLSKGETSFTTIMTQTDSNKIGLTDPSVLRYLILGNNSFQYNNGYVYGSLIKFNLLNSYYTIDGTQTYLAEEN